MITPEIKKRELPEWYREQQRESGKKGGKRSWDSLPEDKKIERIARMNTLRLQKMMKKKTIDDQPEQLG